jgi:cell division protein FtsN
VKAEIDTMVLISNKSTGQCMKQTNLKNQRGGTILGFIIGVVFGLGAALAVAVYVTKVPIPFVNKGQSRSADQDAAEAKKNKDWDPNAPLYGKNPAKPAAPAVAAPTAVAGQPAASAPAVAVKPEAVPKAENKPAVTADPLGDLAKAKSSSSAAEPFVYFVQVGAYRTPEDAEAQRARLSLTGVEAKVTEREQSGRTIYRVRVGPFDKKDDAEKTKEKLDAASLETALVRVQR